MFKSTNRIILIISGLLMMLALIVFYTQSVSDQSITENQITSETVGYGALGAIDNKDLTLADMLTYAVEDEYLAHGEYVAIMDKFGVDRPYSNIAKSELTHLDLLRELYEVRDIVFPSDQSSDHIIIPDTLLIAAKTGVEAEINNIAMYKLFLEYELPDDVRSIFEELMNASQNHLRAFARQVEKLS